MAFIPALITGLGAVIQGFFGVKQSKIDSINKGLEAINANSLAEGEREKAIAAIITAELSSESWIARSWRPLTMVAFVIIVIAYCLGYTTPNLMTSIPDTALIARIFDIVQVGLGGYIGARSVEKIVGKVIQGKMLETLLKDLTKK